MKDEQNYLDNAVALGLLDWKANIFLISSQNPAYHLYVNFVLIYYHCCRFLSAMQCVHKSFFLVSLMDAFYPVCFRSASIHVSIS